MLYDIKYINLNNNEKFTYTVDAKNIQIAYEKFNEYCTAKNKEILSIIKVLKDLN